MIERVTDTFLSVASLILFSSIGLALLATLVTVMARRINRYPVFKESIFSPFQEESTLERTVRKLRITRDTSVSRQV